MKTAFLSLLCVALLAAAEPPAAGKVLVLENENTMEGDVARVGDQYRVRRLVGETWVPAGQVACVCGSLDEAFAFIRARANLGDADERLRLARWCRAHGMHDRAVAEVRAAVELRPGHRETRRMLEVLEQAATRPTSAPPRPAETEGPVPDVEVTADCLGMFASRVQPVLMNACAHCHTQTHPGPFRLQRCYEAGLGSRRTVQQNLTAVLAQINYGQPQASPLLTKAVSDHGKVGQAPLRSRQMTAYRTLDDWVRLTLENNPQLRQRQAPAEPPAPRGETAFGEDAVSTATPGSPAAPARAASLPNAATAQAVPAAQAKPAPPGPPDPFDPGEFNRMAHPNQLKAATPPTPPPANPPGSK
jgi:hypothetical protein